MTSASKDFQELNFILLLQATLKYKVFNLTFPHKVLSTEVRVIRKQHMFQTTVRSAKKALN